MKNNKKGVIEMNMWNLVIIVLASSILFLGLVLVNNVFGADKKYSFVLDGIDLENITVCEGNWHYELMNGTIPCVINETIGGISGETIDWTLSPQDNCERLDGFFPGLNLYNETRAKELFLIIVPKCYSLLKENITNEWLNESKCLCQQEEINFTDFKFYPECDSYNCGSGLMVKDETQ